MMSAIFRSYLQQTNTMCMFRLGAHPVYPTLSFPHVRTVALIDCSPNGIRQILTHRRFPHLKTVHYLSAHPGRVDIYNRFSQRIDWVFPNQKHPFYGCMIEAGKGRVDPKLIRTYIYDVQGEEVELNLPGYGVYSGRSYHTKLLRYLQTPYTPSEPLIPLENAQDSTHAISEYLEERREDAFFAMIMKNK